MEEQWLETSEQQDVLHSLRHAAFCQKQAVASPEMWKWAIIAFHSAIQGALVCHLSGTMQLGALRSADAKKWLAYLQHDRDPNMIQPQQMLAPIGVLFQRATTGEETDQNGNVAQWCNDAQQPSIPADPQTKDAFAKLLSFRNDFAHFAPKGWYIEVSGLPVIFSLLANFIARIFNNFWGFRSLTDLEHTELAALLVEMQVN